MRATWIRAGLLFGTLASAAAGADTLTLTPDRDNTLYERTQGDLSNGAGDFLFFGQTGGNAGFAVRRAVLRFPLGSIPPGSEVTAAQLSVTVTMIPPGATGFDAALHRLSSDWGEGASDALGPEGGGAPAESGDATWLHRFYDTDLWASAGGDFVATPSATAPAGNTNGAVITFSGAGLTSDVQAMVNAPADNHGWIIRGEEDNPGNARRVASRENPTVSSRPALTVTFTPAPPIPSPSAVPTISPLALLLLIAGFGVLAARRLRHRQA